ncbi:MAG: archease [Candidatus Aminicenantes bacterium]|nr:archease [Candidatus Aminicenantes bacterium]
MPHTADGKFRAFGATREEAFANAALAAASLMWDWWAIRTVQSHPVAVQGRDLEQLLYKFLEEIIYLFDAKNFLLGGVEDLKIEDGGENFRLSAVFWGDEAGGRYEIFGAVKAVTYNEMKIELGCGGWTIQVVVDM